MIELLRAAREKKIRNFLKEDYENLEVYDGMGVRMKAGISQWTINLTAIALPGP